MKKILSLFLCLLLIQPQMVMANDDEDDQQIELLEKGEQYRKSDLLEVKDNIDEAGRLGPGSKLVVGCLGTAILATVGIGTWRCLALADQLWGNSDIVNADTPCANFCKSPYNETDYFIRERYDVIEKFQHVRCSEVAGIRRPEIRFYPRDNASAVRDEILTEYEGLRVCDTEHLNETDPMLVLDDVEVLPDLVDMEENLE